MSQKKQKLKQVGKAKAPRWLALFIVPMMVVAGIVLGMSVMRIYFANYHYVVPPFGGTYYTPVIALDRRATVPCETYTVYGDVVDGRNMIVQVKTAMGFSEAVWVGRDGRYEVNIPASELPMPPYNFERNDGVKPIYYMRTERDVRLQLFDDEGNALSGIRTSAFYREGCAAYFHFAPYPSGNQPGPRIDTTEADVMRVLDDDGGYQLFSVPLSDVPDQIINNTTRRFLTCDWTGVIARVYGVDKPLNNFVVSAAPHTNPYSIHYDTTGLGALHTGDLGLDGVASVELEEPGWYYVTFNYGDYDIQGLDVHVPSNANCEQHVALVTLFPYIMLDEPPYYPAS